MKKELKSMTAQQMSQVILDLYEANKEAREYLEFFLDPDEEKLYGKYTALLSKEIFRGKHYKSTARISVIRKIIKRFDSFGTSPEYRLRILEYAAGNLMAASGIKAFSTQLFNGMRNLFCNMVVLAEKNMMFDRGMKSITALLESNYCRPTVRDFLWEGISDTLDELNIHPGLNADNGDKSVQTQQ